MNNLFTEFGPDLSSAALSVLLITGYHLFLRLKLRRDPVYTIQAVNAVARSAWVENIMTTGGKDILAVQTLRNAIMGPTFLASTAVLLIIGTLTLSGQGERLSATWHVLNLFGARHPELWLTKVILLIVDFFVAFFSFTLAIRLFIHVGFMINVPLAMNHKAISPEHVAMHLNRAGTYHSIGMRAYYLSVPLVFWLFGPHFLLISTAVLVAVLYHVDRAPRVLADDYR
ncbi:MAG: DUF599 domain-containing protein [Betaproteobacteria bacterium]|nr:DUF599 domain-containing protein [Betaproteobacteria bacterium]